MVIANIIIAVSHIIVITKLTNSEFGQMTGYLVVNIAFSVGSTVAFVDYTKKFSETFFHGGYIAPPH